MMRKKSFYTAAIAAVFLGAAAFAGNTPLVVVRFNQPRVYFDQQLYSAVSQAVEVKPEVMFDIISRAPTTGNAEQDAQWQATASHNTQAVVAAMQRMGVPMERMHITGQATPGLRYDETHIFVR